MRPVAMSSPVILRQRKRGNGVDVTGQIVSEKTVKGCIQSFGLKYKINLEIAGISADLSVMLWRREFESGVFTHAVIKGQEYRIVASTDGMSDAFIRILLSRG